MSCKRFRIFSSFVVPSPSTALKMGGKMARTKRPREILYRCRQIGKEENLFIKLEHVTLVEIRKDRYFYICIIITMRPVRYATSAPTDNRACTFSATFRFVAKYRTTFGKSHESSTRYSRSSAKLFALSLSTILAKAFTSRLIKGHLLPD